MRTLRTVVVLALAGCSGPQKTADPIVTDNRPPPPVAASADRDQPAPECRGDALELLPLALSHRCDAGGTAAPLPPTVDVALASDALAATSGGQVSAGLALTNRGQSLEHLTLDASCRFANLARVELYSEGGMRHDLVGVGDCSEPIEGCAGHVIEVWLEPGGVATIPFEFPARVEVTDARTCEALPGRALSAGRYRVAIKSPLAAEPFAAKLAVKAVRTLPVSRCARYARDLARLAEPDPARRPAVAAEVAARCRKDPPRQALVDCQLGAKTDQALEACTAK